MMKLISEIISKKQNEDLENNQRAMMMAGGSIVTAIGMKKGGLKGFLLALAGGACAVAGATGKNPLYYLSKQTDKHIFIRQSVLIHKDRETVYSFWRNLENLPKVMKHIKSVEQVDGTRSKWKAEVGGIKVNWDADIVYDVENWRISWLSTPESDIQNSGKVEFLYAGDDYTKLNVLISYEPKLGTVGLKVAKLLNPIFEEEIREDIMKSKKLLETIG